MKMKKATTVTFDTVPAPWELAGESKDTPVLLAFSGGADSSFLLRVLTRQSERDGFPLYAAHLNHGIRGEEALRDAEFCRETANAYGIRIFEKSVSVPSFAKKNRRGLEEEAREIRYAWFSELMKTERIPILVTAHHADDQLETVLFRLCRGSGLKGLCGIAPVRDFSVGKLVRPLLKVTRKEILEACKRENIGFVEDSTNTDTHYARNQLRIKVIPALESLAEHPQKQVLRSLKSLAEDENYLQSVANKALEAAESNQGLLIAKLQPLDTAILKRVLESFLPVPLETVHLDALLSQVREGKEGSFTSLPKNLRSEIRSGHLLFKIDDWRNRSQKQTTKLAFSEGDFSGIFEGWSFKIQKLESAKKIHNSSHEDAMIFHIKNDIIKRDLFWRLPMAGDELLQGKMHKKIGKLYGEKKIPLSVRKQIPLLCDENGIVWAPFLGFRDGMPEAGEVYEVKITSNFCPLERTI